MKRLILFVFFISLTTTMLAQSAEAEIKQVITQLFKGMELGDSAMAHRSLDDHITMVSVVKNKNGEVTLQRESSPDAFLTAVGTPHKGTWFEEFWNFKVQQDGDFATAWCDYAFYLDNTFSHCGVDAFHLYKGKDGWKVFHLADTRRKDGCNIPADIQKKHTP